MTSLYPQLYNHQAAAAAAAAVAGGLPLPAAYSHMEPSPSYASMLATMGQPQLPRSPFIAPQIPHQYRSPNNSPGPTRPLTPRELLDRRDSKSPTRDRHSSLPSPKDKGRLHSPPMPSHHLNFSQQLPKAVHQGLYPKGGASEAYLRDSAAAAASYRHAMYNRKRLSRPPDIVIQGSNKHDLNDDMPSHKRPRSSPGLPLPPLWNSGTHHRGERGLPPPPPLQSSQYTPQPHYPPHFMKGSIIQLANGELKRVEDLRTEDFVNSADVSGDLKIDSSTVVRIDENADKGSAVLGFSVGEHRVQVSSFILLELLFV